MRRMVERGRNSALINALAEGTAKMAAQKTVHEVTYELLRKLGLTTVFGNPGW